jgi:hypothetical protein
MIGGTALLARVTVAQEVAGALLSLTMPPQHFCSPLVVEEGLPTTSLELLQTILEQVFLLYLPVLCR